MDSSHPEKTSRIRDLRAWAPIVLFFAMLWTPLLTFGDRRAEIQRFENRQISEWPEIPSNLKAARRWNDAAEAWFSDRMGTRSLLLRLFAGLSYQLLGSANSFQSRIEVVAGSDGWLFHRKVPDPFGEPQDTLAILFGGHTTDAARVERFVRGMRERAAWLSARGIRFVLVVVPQKHSVYPEMLPSWVAAMSGGSTGPIIAKLREAGVDVVYLRDALVAAKSRHPTYFKTDTHWNRYGAYVGYRELMEHLGLEAIPEESLGFHQVEWQDGGSAAEDNQLAKSIFLHGSLPDFNVIPRPDWTDRRWQVIDTVSGQTLRTTGDPKNLEWQPLTFVNRSARYTGPLLMIRDSSVHAESTYLNASFREVTYVSWAKRWGIEMAGIAELAKPKIVVYQIFERYLASEVPAPALPVEIKTAENNSTSG
jgi:hypothetical protein